MDRLFFVLTQMCMYLFLSFLQIFNDLVTGDIIPYPSYFTNITGSTNHYNILRSTVSVI